MVCLIRFTLLHHFVFSCIFTVYYIPVCSRNKMLQVFYLIRKMPLRHQGAGAVHINMY